MRRFATTAALSLALVAGGSTAATAQAAPTFHSSTSVTRSTSTGLQTVALGSTLTKAHQQAQDPSRRRYRTRTRVVRRRSFASRIFGFLGFLLCLPFLIILVIALVFMMRRNGRRRQEEMMMRQDQFDRYQR